MKLNYFSNYQPSHLIALAAASFVHIGIAAWSMMPSNPVVINQQMIQVSFVAPNAAEKSSNSAKKQAVVELKKEAALQQKQNNKNEKLGEEKTKSFAGKKTSGRVDPNAVATNAAESDPVFDAAYLNNPAPSYPASAKRKGVQGKVLINVVVRTDGTAASVAVSRSSGSDILDEAALDAVKQWRFIPAKRGHESVQANVIVPVEFKII